MNAKNISMIFRIAITLLLLIVGWIIIGMFAVNYLNGIFLLLSLFFVWPVKILAKTIYNKLGWISILLSLFTLVISLQFLWRSYQVRLYGECGTIVGCIATPTPFKEYTVRIKIIDFSTGVFESTASVVYEKEILGFSTIPDDFDTQVIELPSELVNSSSGSFLLRTVSIPGPDGRQATLVSSSGSTQTENICYYNCPSIKVELIDFPKETFYQAKNSQDLKVFEFGNTMSASWTIFGFENSHGDIAFNYIPAPFNLFLPVLRPLVGISSLSEWLVGAIGLVGGIILTIIGKPTLGIVKNKFEAWLNDKLTKRNTQKATLIISSKGDQKEIKRK